MRKGELITPAPIGAGHPEGSPAGPPLTYAPSLQEYFLNASWGGIIWGVIIPAILSVSLINM